MRRHRYTHGKPSAEMSITKFRARVSHVEEEMLAKGWTSLAVTRRGEPVLAVIPWHLLESMIETDEIMSDPKMMEALQRSREDAAAGRTYTTEEMRRELGIPPKRRRKTPC